MTFNQEQLIKLAESLAFHELEPMVEEHELIQTRSPTEGRQTAHLAMSSEFKSWLEFSLWTLERIDFPTDSHRWVHGLQDAQCEPVLSHKARSLALQIIGSCKKRLPEKLTVWPDNSQFILIYNGWMSDPKFSVNLRLTLVGKTPQYFFAFHSRTRI